MPKRLLIITQHFWPENFRINDMVDGFLADGIVVDIVCGLPNYPHGEWFSGYTARGPMLEDYHGANLYRCREVPRKGNTSLRIFLNYISYPITAALTLHKLPGGYDAVLCYNTSPVLMSFPAILASRKFKAPLTNYVLDIWPENLYSVLNIQNKALRKVASAVSDWHYRRADRLIAMNEGLKQRLIERAGAKNARGCVEKEKRYAVIAQYCEDFYDCGGVGDVAGVKSAQVETGAPTHMDSSPNGNSNSNSNGGTMENEPFTIQFAGNLSPAQGLDTALEAMAMLHAQGGTNQTGKTTPPLRQMQEQGEQTVGAASAMPDGQASGTAQNMQSPIRLMLVGDGMSREALQAKAAALGLGGCVQFYGSADPADMPTLNAKADALLVSLADTADLGLTVPAKFASCMASGKPLLVSMNGEGAHIATQSGGALVSQASDAAALAQNIATLAAMPPAQRGEMGAASYRYYKAHFNRATLLREIETFIF